MLSRLRRTKTVPIVAIGLLGGWAMVDLTGSRAAGGVVLFVLGCWAGFVWLFRDGWRTTVSLAVVYLGCFVLAHVLGLLIGSWPAVIAVALVAAAASYAWSDRGIEA
ncbi:MAG: hypothetical protein ACTHJM_13600 [Marmoricola sp.]